MKREKESLEMSSSENGFWFDDWWPLFVILFGIAFVALLVSFAPAW
jgi:hypothetical protein